ncbi:MAG: hypothetical protein ABSF53_12755 [Terracidiphilus sp.]|jgi:hypothetical protein
MLQQVGQLWSRSPKVRDVYSHEAPSAANPFGIFKDEWSSAVPGFKTGQAGLFNDHRIQWLEAQLGTFQGKRVLELGPLEAGHTTMMERAGAVVTAIEANQRAFLKCLIVKNALHLNAEFLYGDFRPYIEESRPGAFHFVLAAGVLYHMLEPAKLLHDIARMTDSFGIWTHYYDPKIMEATPRFDRKPRYQTVEGKTVEVYKQNYLFSATARGFCGGSAPTSYWLTRRGLLEYVGSLGFDVCVGDENPSDPRGPSILFFARRKIPANPPYVPG